MDERLRRPSPALVREAPPPPDFESGLIDGAISKVHADATGAKGAEAAAIGRSRGGLTTKLHGVVDAIGLPLRIHPTPGDHGDHPQAEALFVAQAACPAATIVKLLTRR